jgi:hypothetical protein
MMIAQCQQQAEVVQGCCKAPAVALWQLNVLLFGMQLLLQDDRQHGGGSISSQATSLITTLLCGLHNRSQHAARFSSMHVTAVHLYMVCSVAIHRKCYVVFASGIVICACMCL